MPRFLWIVLIASALVQPFRGTGLLLQYQLNRSYISSQFCEQREEPTSRCQGKCYLKKQLKKAEQEKQQTPLTQKKTPIDLLLQAHTQLLFPGFLYLARPQSLPILTLKVYHSPSRSIFHPPHFWLDYRLFSP